MARRHWGGPLERVIEFGRGFRAAWERAGLVARSPQAKRVGATIRAIATAEKLPTEFDSVALIPPTRRAWVRRVRGENLWIYFLPRVDAETGTETVMLISIVSSPPDPVDDR